jgi:hypothetical protein
MSDYNFKAFLVNFLIMSSLLMLNKQIQHVFFIELCTFDDHLQYFLKVLP